MSNFSDMILLLHNIVISMLLCYTDFSIFIKEILTMTSVKIIHTGDCHLGSSRKHINSGKRELIDTFLRILSLCRKDTVDFLLIAGDLFDSPFVDRETVSEVAAALAGIPDTQVIIASGNHDCACADSVYDTFAFSENVHLFTSATDYIDFPDKNTRIYGAGFTSTHCSESFFRDFSVNSPDTINIGVFHGEVTTSSGCLYNPISESQIAASRLDYLALGHIHMRSEILKSGNTFYAYCGCPDSRGFDETGVQGIYMGTVGKNRCELDFVNLSSRLYITDTVDISGASSSHSIAEMILSYLQEIYGINYSDNLYKLTLKGSISPDVIMNSSHISKLVSEYVQFCYILDSTETEILDLDELAKEPTLRGVFVQKMLKRLDNAAPNERTAIHEALKIGLRAFNREVKLLDN